MSNTDPATNLDRSPLRVSLTVHGEGPTHFACFGGELLVARSALDGLRDERLAVWKRQVG